jgi:hypothetical protein
LKVCQLACAVVAVGILMEIDSLIERLNGKLISSPNALVLVHLGLLRLLVHIHDRFCSVGTSSMTSRDHYSAAHHLSLLFHLALSGCKYLHGVAKRFEAGSLFVVAEEILNLDDMVEVTWISAYANQSHGLLGRHPCHGRGQHVLAVLWHSNQTLGFFRSLDVFSLLRQPFRPRSESVSMVPRLALALTYLLLYEFQLLCLKQFFRHSLWVALRGET